MKTKNLAVLVSSLFVAGLAVSATAYSFDFNWGSEDIKVEEDKAESKVDNERVQNVKRAASEPADKDLSDAEFPASFLTLSCPPEKQYKGIPVRTDTDEALEIAATKTKKAVKPPIDAPLGKFTYPCPFEGALYAKNCALFYWNLNSESSIKQSKVLPLAAVKLADDNYCTKWEFKPCVDSDPARTPTIAGVVYASYQSIPDLCAFNNQKYDFFCNGLFATSEFVTCPKGCYGGACLP